MAGVLGLITGPIAMIASKKKGVHTRIGSLYFCLVALVCASALVLAFRKWEQNWWFVLIALFSFHFALKGFRAARNRKAGWLGDHISGMLGSYIALATAALVVNSGSFASDHAVPTVFLWVLPTMIGIPLIRLATRRVRVEVKAGPDLNFRSRNSPEKRN